jgi:NAD+ synthase (glutamine-hydrolysing)
MKISCAQLNPIVGDVEGNTLKVLDIVREAKQSEQDIILFPELCLSGYPPKDVLLYKVFNEQIHSSLKRIISESKGLSTALFIGHPYLDDTVLYNRCTVISDGEVLTTYDKHLLPTYDVFDESRYFKPGQSVGLVTIKNKKIGITICEDAWDDKYSVSPITNTVNAGAEMIVNLSASPYEMNKEHVRQSLFQNHAKRHNVPVIVVNQVGANDELIFDGHSFYCDASGDIIAQAPGFESGLFSMENGNLSDLETSLGNSHKALVLGIRDYVQKSGFSQVLIGLSGGIDSALTATLAVDALGKENVLGITMPSEFSSEGSVSDSVRLAENLGIEIQEIPIKAIFNQYSESLSPLFKDLPFDLAEENLQSRIRGTLLMAVSNKFNRLLLTTGNKSEMAVGYCTIYGDMNGALGVIGDVYKTKVYELSRYLNKDGERIPVSTIEKAPSAELRPDQKDQDSLPEYDVLDGILNLFIEEKQSTQSIIEAGYDEQTVKWVTRLVKLNEYKRFQAPPILKLTPTAFGTSRRMPIVSRETL